MTTRRDFLAGSAALAGGTFLPLAQAAPWGTVHEISGDVRVNGFPMTRNHVIQPGQTLSTGADGRVWFGFGGDAYFLRPRSELRLRSNDPREALIDALRLVTGALG